MFLFVTVVKQKFGYDDALDAFGCHGIGGIWGGIATGIFASKAINSAGANGLIYGNIKITRNSTYSNCSNYCILSNNDIYNIKSIKQIYEFKSNK